jgi:hypothetical protein
VETVRVLARGDGPPTFALAPRPGELPVAVWRLDHGPPARGREMAHAHDFPMLVYSADARGAVPAGGHEQPVAAGDLFVLAPGEVIGPFDTAHAVTGRGWSVSFTAEALGADVPGSALAWRTHPLLFPFVRGRAYGVLRLTVRAADRPAWTTRITTLERELSERADGYREAVLAHLTLLLVEVARLAADVVDDLRINREPLLADVFAVIEHRYPEALSLRDVARALAYAHERGVVHRDIKPDNVLLSGGSATVTDFGIAKAISASRATDSSSTLTQLGTSVGTPTYMAPEQAAADPSTDHRADIYSFGCMGYEMLSGRPPFAGLSPQKMLAAQMSERPKPIGEVQPDTPPILGDLIMRCLEKDPDARPQKASELTRVLDAVTSAATSSMPTIAMSGPGALKRALVVYALAFIAVFVVAKASIVAIGLPDLVLPASLVLMALGLPIILATAYVQQVARRAYLSTPRLTPGGGVSAGVENSAGRPRNANRGRDQTMHPLEK